MTIGSLAALPDRGAVVHPCRTFDVSVGASSPSARLAVRCEPPLDVATLESGRVVVLLAGQVYEGHAAALGEARRDPGSALAVEGSFAAAVLDGDDAWVLTDHVGSWPLYVRSAPDGTAVSTEPPAGGDLDPSGAGAYLASGHVVGSRTPFAGVAVAPPGSIAVLSLEQPRWQSYWTFRPTENGAIDEHEFARELEPLLLSAVARRVGDQGPVAVSLSGGSDVRTILAALVEVADTSRLRSFSYSLPHARGRIDATVAARLARLAGIEHRIVSSLPPSLRALSALNARRGAAVANLCDEAYAWQRAPLGEDDTVVVGDEAFGWIDAPLASVEDVLRTIDVPPRLRLGGLVAAPLLEDLDDAYRRTLDDMVSGADPGRGGLHELKDALYVRHRIPHVLAPWRRRYAGERARVAAPLLDRRILDLVAQLGTDQRRGKRAFRAFAQKRFHRFFDVPLARRTGYFLDWSRLVAAEREALAAALSEPSATDLLVTPASAHRLLQVVASRSHRTRRHACRLTHAAGRRLPFRRVPGRAWLDEQRLTAAEVRLVRLLVLRERLGSACGADGGR